VSSGLVALHGATVFGCSLIAKMIGTVWSGGGSSDDSGRPWTQCDSGPPHYRSNHIYTFSYDRQHGGSLINVFDNESAQPDSGSGNVSMPTMQSATLIDNPIAEAQ